MKIGKIILAVGMPRAGSGWHYNLVHDLILASGGQDAREIRQRYLLSRFLTEVNCNIGVLSAYRLFPVSVPALLGNTYVIKAHAGPKKMARFLIQRGFIQPTYIYRDPRDALLSAYEYGRRKRDTGRIGPFADLESLDDAIDFMFDYVQISEAWLACEQSLNIRYEDLLLNYAVQATRILTFFGLSREDPTMLSIVDQYRPDKGHSKQRGTHFVKGKIGRYREKMTSHQQQRCLDFFGDYLERMGYPVD
jgi:hypothetical protein